MATAVADTPIATRDAAPALEAAPVAEVGDPQIIGVPTFLAGSFALGLTLLGVVPAAAAGAPLAVILCGTALGQLVTALWAIRLNQTAVAGVFGIFTGFWSSYGVLVLGLTHGWFGVVPADVKATQEIFLISWLAVIVLLTLGTLRLPKAYTVLFVLIDLALGLVLWSAAAESSSLAHLGGVATLAFAAVGVYIYLHVASLATGGDGLELGTPASGG